MPPTAGLSGVGLSNAGLAPGVAVAITRSRAPAPGSVTSPTLALRTPGQSGVTAGTVTMPRLTTPIGRPSGLTPPPVAAVIPAPAAVVYDTPRQRATEATTADGPDDPPLSVVKLTAVSRPAPALRLPNGFQAVLPVPLLTGGVWPGDDPPTGAAFALTLFEAVYGAGPLPVHATDPVRQADGSWCCRFPAKLMPATVRFKLQAVRDQWGGELLQPDPCRFQLRLDMGKGRATWLSRTERTGLAVDLDLPPPALANGDVLVTGRPFGPADAWVLKKAADELPQILGDLRKQLQNLPDRRKAPRVPYDGPLLMYPVDEDGGVYPAVPATCVDVSPTGVCCLPTGSAGSRYVYVEFPRVTQLAGLAVLVELLRKGSKANGAEPVAGMYRVDLDGPVDAVRSNPNMQASYY